MDNQESNFNTPCGIRIIIDGDRKRDQTSTDSENVHSRPVDKNAAKHIFEEAKLRREKFIKLIEEHEALVKRIEELEKENSGNTPVMHPQAISA